MEEWLQSGLLNWALVTIIALLGGWTALHALINKRHPRAAIGWVVVCITLPVLGAVAYFLFGINRIQTRARELQRTRNHGGGPRKPPKKRPWPMGFPDSLDYLARVSRAVGRWPATSGNTVRALHNGEEAYPAMLAAIEGAQRTLFLSSYIFDAKGVGERFVTALAEAVGRGVDVRVIVDGVGVYYSWPRVPRRLRKLGIPHVRFIPPRLIPPNFHINLRNHRKLLIADGNIAFAGGINIRANHMVTKVPPRKAASDVHFRLTGPVARQLERVFLEDWAFACNEPLPEPGSLPTGNEEPVWCSVIADGPNEDLDRLASIFVGIASSARKELLIMTPYFLPSRELTVALQTAALKGVVVRVVLPEKSNLRYVDWATRNMLWELLGRGVEVYYQPGIFSHTKLIVADRALTLVGSANVDERSLRLNFELMVELYDREFAAEMAEFVRDAARGGRRVTLEEVEKRGILTRVRDSFAWMFSPYL